MKAEQRKKTPYKEKINTQIPSGRCVWSTSIYGNVPDPLRMYTGKDCLKITLISTTVHDRTY